MNRYKNLNIWKRSVALATEIYRVTSDYPKEEKYGIVSQLRRCVVSISSNIAEGAGRGSNKQFEHFLNIAYGSSYELETQMIISQNLGFINKEECDKLCSEIVEIQKMIYTFNKKISSC